MHVSYEYEQKLKQDYLNELFKPFVSNVKLNATFEPTHYRNKCQMTYKLSKSKKVVCGFYEEYSHRLVTVSDCMLQSKQANKIIAELNKILSKHKIMPYDERTREGIIRHVYVRYGFNTKEAMLVIVTNGEFFPGRNNVLKDLLKLDLGITTVIQNYNHRDTSIVLGEENKVLYGPGFIYEKVGNYKFKISPNSFFQVNTLAMKKLYDKAIEMAEIKKTDRVIDAYCGVGTISIFASKYAKEVIGVELNKQAIKDAKINQKINNITNINFIADDATNFMTHMAKERFEVDVVIMDPPREGSTKQFINAIGYLKPKKVVYISCDPKTLKRDLYDFGENNYYVEKIEGFDNFSKTQHLECAAVLVRKEH
jgi:23S rRNA (uracil1939-C5)-methyltransferase